MTTMTVTEIEEELARIDQLVTQVQERQVVLRDALLNARPAVRPTAVAPSPDIVTQPAAEVPHGAIDLQTKSRLSRRGVFGILGGATAGLTGLSLVTPTPAWANAASGSSTAALVSATAVGATTVSLTDPVSVYGYPPGMGAGTLGIGVGSTLVIDPGPNMEVRYVTATNVNDVTVAALTKAHPAGALVYASAGLDTTFDQALLNPPPINASVFWRRRFLGNPTEPGYVNATLAISSEGVGPYSYTWPLSVVLTSTTHPGATGLVNSNDFGIYSRINANGVGFAAATFLDVYHAGATSGANSGLTIGLDMEIHKDGNAGSVIGVNVSNQAPSNGGGRYVDTGIQVQGSPGNGFTTGATINSGWQTGLKIQQGDPQNYANYGGNGACAVVLDSGLGVATTVGSSTGIKFVNQFTNGIDMGTNNIVLHQTRKLWLAPERGVYLWVDATGYVRLYRDGVNIATW
jgi:hypothetical protein